MKKLIPLYLIFVCFLFPVNIAFSEEETVTSEDIDELRNQMSNLQTEITDLKSSLQSFTENSTSNEKRINTQLGKIDEKLSHLQESIEAGFTITWSFGNQQTWLSIGYGITVALAVMMLGFFVTTKNNERIAKRLLHIDFSEINDELIKKITNLKSDIDNLDENSQVVVELISKQKQARDIMLPYIKGLFFGTYDATLSRMSELKEEELKKITKLHDYILGVNNLHSLSIEPVTKQLEDIIHSISFDDDTKKEKIVESLKQEFEKRLTAYQIVYGRMHLELEGIKWIYLKKLEQ